MSHRQEGLRCPLPSNRGFRDELGGGIRMNAGKRQNFFVRHLPVDDPRRQQGRVFQVQVVDRHGLATAFAYLGEDDDALVVGDHSVPQSVLVAVKSLKPGEGRFVDSSGAEVLPKDLPATGG